MTSKKILDFQKNGAKILKRSKRNSNDAASSEKAPAESVKQIELKYQKKIDIIVGVQPTSPIKTGADFDNAIKIFKKNKLDSLFTSTLINDYCVWSKKINKFSAKYNFKIENEQNIDSKYLENGSFYIFETSKFKRNKNRLFGKIGTYVQNKIKSFQIDTYEDIFIVDSIFKNKEIKKYNK